MSGKIPLNKRIAAKIAGTYALAAGLWILLSDKLLARLFTDVPTVIKISTYKGWFFVGLTSWILYVFIRRDTGLIQRSEKALKDSIEKIKDEKAKIEAMLAAVGDGICIVDRDFIITYQNQVHRNSLGDHAGEYCYRAFAGKDRVCTECLVEMSFNDGGTHHAERCYPAEGGVRYFETTASPLPDSNGGIIAGIEIVRDITDRKKIEGNVLRTKKLESMGILARGLSHDFNNLLTGILGNVSLAKTSLKPDDYAFSLLTKAEDACLRAEDLTYQLNTIAKSGESYRKTLRIGGLIKEASESALIGSEIECTYHFSDDLWAVTLNEEQISQAVYNIVANACDAMNDKGHLTVRAENADIGSQNGNDIREGKYVKITIEDEGAGIEKELLPKIFDIYFTTKKLGSARATGFSLAASYFVVKNHQGYIFAESTVGKGTTFFIYIPIHSSATQNAVR